jgi:hypothetical protein
MNTGSTETDEAAVLMPAFPPIKKEKLADGTEVLKLTFCLQLKSCHVVLNFIFTDDFMLPET